VIERLLLQTNSATRTTILQQLGGLSSAEWTMVFSNVVMAAASLALVIYAALAIREAKRDRRKDSIEKQPENLYSPMFEIMDQKEVYPDYGDHEHEKIYYCRLLKTDCAALRSALTSYGHYLDFTEHAKIKTLLSMGLPEKDVLGPAAAAYLKFPADQNTADFHGFNTCFIDCLTFIREKRERLTAELRTLS
jgi:hypothetical protein